MKAKWRGCADQNEYCGAWAADGECDRNAGYMRLNCRLSCQLCSPPAAGAEAEAPEAAAAA